MPTPNKQRLTRGLRPFRHMKLEDAQVQFYHENGYLHLEGLTNEHEVNAIRGILQQLSKSALVKRKVHSLISLLELTIRTCSAHRRS